MSKAAYADEKGHPVGVDVEGLDSDGASSINTLTALIAEGVSHPIQPVIWVRNSSLTSILFVL